MGVSQQSPSFFQFVTRSVLGPQLLAYSGPAAQPHLYSWLSHMLASSWSRFLFHLDTLLPRVSPIVQCRWLGSVLALAFPGHVTKVRLSHLFVPQFLSLSNGSNNGWQIFALRIRASTLDWSPCKCSVTINYKNGKKKQTNKNPVTTQKTKPWSDL